MRDIDSTFTETKNQQSNQPIFLYTIFNYDGASTNLYFADYSENVTYDGQEYTKFPISHDAVTEDTTGEISSVSVTLSNVSRLIQAYLENYDFNGKKVYITLVWGNQLDDTDAYLREIFYIDSYSADQNNVEFTLTSKFDVLSLQLPARKYSRNYCGFKFKSTECGYAGAETECNKTLARCRVLENSSRFGAFPSVPSRQIYTK